jgi:hypothetical protein
VITTTLPFRLKRSWRDSAAGMLTGMVEERDVGINYSSDISKEK